MTELSSRDGAPPVPAPPSPPAPLHEDDAREDWPDSGPATSAMGALPADDVASRGFDGGYTTFTPVPGDILGGSPTAATRPVPGLAPGKPERKGRPRVTVRGPRRAKLVLRRVDP